MLIAIDSGVKKAGVALFDDMGELAHAYIAKGDSAEETARAVLNLLSVPAQALSRACIEKPQVYQQRKTDPNDLIDIARMIGAVAFALRERNSSMKIELVLPREWKGQVPKDTMIRRIQSRIRDEELPRIDLPKAKKAQLDVWDAVGIGLWAVGRL